MSELINVDFKSKKVLARQDLDNPTTHTPWKASKDPAFKEFVEGIAFAAESFTASGGDWGKMVVVMFDNPTGGEDEEICFTLWDQSKISDEEASDALIAGANKLLLVAEDQGGSDEPV